MRSNHEQFFDETAQGLLEAIEIEKGTIPVKIYYVYQKTPYIW